MSATTRAPDAAFVPPAGAGERLVELAPVALRTMATLVAVLRPGGAGGRAITRREARRLLTEAETLVAALRELLREGG